MENVSIGPVLIKNTYIITYYYRASNTVWKFHEISHKYTLSTVLFLVVAKTISTAAH